MNKPLAPVQADLGEPILFRTATREVFESTLSSGSIWLRSDQYYQRLEDGARSDASEGANSARTLIPLALQVPSGPTLTIQGPGEIGQMMVPHYLVSLHGSSIVETEREAFGGYTFGIRSLSRLSAEILYQCSLQLRCTGYRFGHIYYQYSALALSLATSGGAAIAVGGLPSHYLNPINTDVLRKRPIKPFIDQDEWRIVIFTSGYLDDDSTAALKTNVAPTHFYPYLTPARHFDA